MLTTNEPRCDLMSRPDGGRCRAQAAGLWRVDETREVKLCEDDRLAVEESLQRAIEWRDLIDVGTRARTASRLLRMQAGYFG